MNTNGGEEKKSNTQMAKAEKYLMATQFVMRLLAFATTLAAAWIMVTSNQTALVFGTNFSAKYSYSPALKFFVMSNFIACAFSALSLMGCILRRKTSINYFFFFLHDLVIMTLLMAACAAATAIGYVGKYGNKYAGWGAICEYFGKYCKRTTVSVVFSYLAFVLYFCLAIVSAHKARQQH